MESITGPHKHLKVRALGNIGWRNRFLGFLNVYKLRLCTVVIKELENGAAKVLSSC
jgi:hypothetical protein